MIAKRMPRLVLPMLCLAALAVSAAAAESPAPLGLPDAAAADSIRTNLWLTEALMAEIVTATAEALPPPPAAVRLVAQDTRSATELFATVASRVLQGRGYELYIPDEDPAREGAADVAFTFGVLAVDLAYPEVGRTLGIWRHWIERELSVTAAVELAEVGSGRLLLKERLTRSFGDRVPDGDFKSVNSGLYDFTNAETDESGWQRRIEEIVVIGALAGLVAIYFANTRD